MARNSPTLSHSDKSISTTNNPSRTDRIKFLLSILLVMMDLIVLLLAFLLGYYSRPYLPLFAIPAGQPPIVDYIPTMILHVGIVLAMIYFNRLYHQRRTFSRFDQLRSIVAVVTTGAVLVYGVQELIFRDSALYQNYPRSMFVYVLFFSVLLVGFSRELHRKVQVTLRHRGYA
ncbi:MAG: hypothetical protein Q9P01_18240, partial [Anaerolineae bacterium]|nr:hypothetical protein [Anaerolineae bacterium]